MLFNLKTYLSPWLLPPVSLFLLTALGPAEPMRFTWLQFVPSLDAVVLARSALHELIGQAWYRLVAMA